MQLSEFAYHLPKELIAQYPLERRDASRLLVLNRENAEVTHRNFTDIADYLEEKDLLVVNDTQVLPARLIGKKETGGKVDCLLLKKKTGSDFSVLLKPSRLKPGQRINFNGGSLQATVIDRNTLRFDSADADYIYEKGLIPLPPYIKREPSEEDFYRYQTVFAREPGAVAAPTAGLHFTPDLLSKITAKGVKTVSVTLHINYATFNPVKEDDISRHKMYKEYYRMGKDDFSLVRQRKQSGSKIVCVGTTSARVLETLAGLKADKRSAGGDYRGYTDLFIYPGYSFKIVDRLLTNFHLPRSTLLMLVSAFAGADNIKRAYAEAIKQGYRFYSYGDAMLII